MDAELKAKWLKELRSSNQTRRMYHANFIDRGDCFCGVGCLFKAMGGKTESYAGFKNQQALLDRARTEVGVNTIEKVIYLNDACKMSLTQIADWVEENVK
jgi:hypothetical protein